MSRTIALALAFLAILVPEAQATTFRVVVVPGLGLEHLSDLARRGAVGLLVPGAGPETSAAMARAALARGEVRNSLRGGFPTGPALVPIETAATLPAGPAIVVGLPAGGKQANDKRYPIAVVGRGYSGLLISDSTRIPGLVSIADIAPTALGREDGLGRHSAEGPAETLLDLDRRIRQHNDVRLPAMLLAAVLIVGLALVFPAAALPAFGAGLLTNLVLGAAGVSSFALVLLVIGLAIALAAPIATLALSSLLRLGALLAGILAAYLVAMAVDVSTVALSPFGPTQNARFYGISNLLETLLLVPALAGAAVLTRRLGPAWFGLVALLAFVTIAGNRFGADGGGAIVLAAGHAVLAALLFGARRRALLAAAGGAAVAVALLFAIDAATGGSSHVTRSVGRGPGELAGDLGNRVALSYERIASHWYTALLIGAGALALAWLAVRTLRSDETRERRAVPLALAAAVAVSLVVNDSPNDVVLGGLVGYLTVERGMLPARCAPGSFSLSRLRSSWSGAGAGRPSRPRPRP